MPRIMKLQRKTEFPWKKVQTDGKKFTKIAYIIIKSGIGLAIVCVCVLDSRTDCPLMPNC